MPRMNVTWSSSGSSSQLEVAVGNGVHEKGLIFAAQFCPPLDWKSSIHPSDHTPTTTWWCGRRDGGQMGSNDEGKLAQDMSMGRE